MQTVALPFAILCLISACADAQERAIPAAPTTPQSALVFATDWSRGVGRSDDVLRAAWPRRWDVVIGGTSALSIVPCRKLGFPSEHCLQVDGIPANPPLAVQELATGQVSLLPGRGAWPIPEVGETIYYRLYQRWEYPHSDACEPPPLSNNNHAIEERSGGAANWSWIVTSSEAGFNPVFTVWASASAPNRFALRNASGAPVYLARSVVYRIEWSHQRTGTHTRAHEIRISDATGKLLFSTADFRKEAWEGSASLAGFSAPYNAGGGLSQSDGLQLGTNGMGWGGACDLHPTRPVTPMWYVGPVAVSRTGWIGPYRAGEAR